MLCSFNNKPITDRGRDGTDGDLDPLTYQDGTELIYVRIGMDIDSWNSRVTLWGRNVTDERTYYGSFGQPLGSGRMNGYPTEPATYGILFSKNLGLTRNVQKGSRLTCCPFFDPVIR